MKAISVFPGKPNSVHVADLPKPSLDQVPNGRGVLVPPDWEANCQIDWRGHSSAAGRIEQIAAQARVGSYWI